MARPVTVTLEHSLGVEGAKTRIDERFGDLQKSIAGNLGLKFERSWADDQLQFIAKGLGQKITGEIDVFPQHVRITVVLPGLLANMADALKGRVEKQGQILLEAK
ncbi:MAG: polyhydroxyalkanoic acid system family protein [Pseudomonadota bacterium]